MSSASGITAVPALIVAMLAPAVLAQTQPPRPAAAPSKAAPRPAQQTQSVNARIDQLQRLVRKQEEVLESLRKVVGEQDARYRELQRVVEEGRRGQLTQQALQPPPAPQPAQQQPVQQAQARSETQAERPVQVGAAPAPEAPRTIAQIFDQPGVLTPRGKTVIEPSLQYGYSSANRVALVGYTVVPALLIGLVDVREVKRNTMTGAVSLRYGLTNRAEIEAKLPYVYRSDTAVSREIFTGTANETVFESRGSGIGDFEVTGRYQLTDGGVNKPYLIGSLRVKSRTGLDPFEAVTDCITRCVGNTTGTGQPLELATGSGFTTLQPGLTWLYPSDPAVFFGSFTYAYNFRRSGISRRLVDGGSEFIGDVKAGDTIGLNVGMGLSLNERSSFSIGVDLNSLGRTKVNGTPLPTSVRTQLASLVLGYGHLYSPGRAINVSIGAGLTRDTPDLTISVRMPFNL